MCVLDFRVRPHVPPCTAATDPQGTARATSFGGAGGRCQARPGLRRSAHDRNVVLQSPEIGAKRRERLLAESLPALRERKRIPKDKRGRKAPNSGDGGERGIRTLDGVFSPILP